MMSEFELLTEELIEQIEGLSQEDKSSWLFLSEHEEYQGRWKVEGLSLSFFFDFEDIIGPYRTVSPAKLKNFLDRAADLEYRVMFTEEPQNILGAWDNLSAPPPFEINSNLPGTISGLLPFQLQGYNYLKNPDLKGGFALWSTGTGKSIFEISMVKHHMEVNDDADLCIVVVKPNNKRDTQKKFEVLGNIDSFILDGTKGQREEMYSHFETLLGSGVKTVIITNYEKFRDDEDQLSDLIRNRRTLIFWDEMPTKLRNRSTKLYQSVARVFYGSTSINWKKKTPLWLRQYMLTATPIENSPVDLLNCIRLLDPDVFPTIKEWERQFVATRNYFTKDPETFHNLDKMGLELEFMTHQVNKEDLDIAKMFPKVISETKYIDWDTKNRKIYDTLQEIARKLKEEEEEEISILALISVLQMLCDAPEMVSLSALNRQKLLDHLDAEKEESDFTGSVGSEAALMLLDAVPEGIVNDGHPKIERLKEILTEEHLGEKTIVFSTWSDYLFPGLEAKLNEWGISYVVYRGTDKQKNLAKDAFRNDPDIMVFLSSDAGSDSIDLPEASVVVHYNLPWKWSTKIQRENRANRVNSLHKTVRYYILVMDNSVEYRKMELIEQKYGYHKVMFEEGTGEESLSSRMTSEDLSYILTG